MTPSIPGLEMGPEIGRGAHSIVYGAQRNGMDLAVKVQKTKDPDEAIRLRREALALARVRHPGLAAVRDVGESEGRVYIVMDYVKGRPLSLLLEKGPLPEKSAIALVLDVARALAALHGRGLIHRDLKPSNILVDERGQARLIDLGFVEKESQVNPAEKIFVGTWNYAAPEQAGLVSRPMDSRADLYGLGAVFFEMITGRLPFATDRVADLIEKHASGEVPDPRDINHSLGDGVSQVIRKLLAKDPDDRYQLAEGLARDLERLGLGQTKDFTPATHSGWRAPGSESPLVGREKEVSLLRRRWNELRPGGGRAILIRGPAGAGKSRLVRELFQAPLSVREMVLVGKCSATDPVPLAPIRDALDEWLRRAERLSPQVRERVEALVRQAAGPEAPLLRGLSPRLGRALAGVEGPPLSVSDQFFDVVSDFLLRLVQSVDRAALVLEDLHWVDDATHQVLVRIAPRLAASGLLLVTTVRGGEMAPISAEIADSSDTDEITLTRFDGQRIGEMVAAFLGGDEVDSGVVGFIAQRCEGNPFLVTELLQALLDTGALELRWGRWALDQGGAERLRLPQNVLDLVLARVADIGSEAHLVLAAAAVLGNRFSTDLLPAVAGVDSGVVRQALEDGRRSHLVEPAEAGDWYFSHDRIREALLARSPESRRKANHRRAADALISGPQGERTVFEVAEHLYLGEAEPRRVMEASRAAGAAAVMGSAFERGRIFLTRAAELAAKAGVALDAGFEILWGESLFAVSRLPEAAAHFEQALTLKPGPLDQARIHMGLARIFLGRLDMPASRSAINDAFNSLGEQAPGRGPAALVRSFFKGLVRVIFPGPAVKDPERYGRLKMLAALYQFLTVIAYFEIDRWAMVLTLWESWGPTQKMGPSSELSSLYANVTLLVGLMGRAQAARRVAMRARRIAESIHDPIMVARCELFQGFALNFVGETLEAERTTSRCLSARGHLLPNSAYLTGVADIAANLLMRGYATEALGWVEKGLERASRAGAQSTITQGHTYRCYAGPALAILGRPAEGAAHLNEFEAIIAPTPEDRWRWGQHLANHALFLVEQGETGETLEKVFARYDKLKLRPKHTPHQMKGFYVARAYGAADRYAKAAPDQKSDAKAALGRALSELDKAGPHPTLAAHRWLAMAKQWRIDGEFDPARGLLERAERIAERSDNPWVIFEVFAERARLLRLEGHEEPAQREAVRAHRMAMDRGWLKRARVLQEEFSLEGGGPGASFSSGAAMLESVHTVTLRRHLDALLDIAVVSMARTDPDEQARVVLDEVVKILGAERAFLFLSPDDGQNLYFKAGRDIERRDLPDDASYSSTAISQVRIRRTPILMSGPEGAEVEAAASVVARGLRSLLAAPMVFHGRLVGMIYADSRLARGIFSRDDLAVLRALANHIAIAWETARSHRLEVQLEAEQAQKRLAEALRRVSTDLNSTLQLSEVLGRLLSNLSHFVSVDRALVFLKEGEGLRVVASTGFPVDTIPSADLALSNYPVLAEALQRRERLWAAGLDGGTLHYLGLGSIVSWIVVPLISRDMTVGLLTLDRLRGDAFTEKDADMVVTFSGPAAVAIENARLFSEVQRQAVTDGLTGLYNRRHFFELAEQELRRSQRYQRPFSVLMIDIDRFKSVNDRFGHLVGDDVLAGVVTRMRRSLRNVDVVGRYGGEEFVVFLPESTVENARVAAERLRKAVGDSPISVRSGEIGVTVSVGIAAGSANAELTAILKQADDALLKAKQEGRNRVV